MSNSIRIKRRAASGDAGAPASLKNGELAYNEADNNLYYGFGDNGSGVATSVPIVGGVLDELLQDIADISGTATAADQVIISTAAGQLALESGATLRTSLGVDAAGTDNSTNVTLAGSSKDYITLSGQALTINQIDLTDDVTGLLPDGNIAGMASSKLSGTVPATLLPQATTTAKGAIKLFSVTAQSATAQAVTTAAGKTYGIQLNSDGRAVVNVPWQNTQTPVRAITVDSHPLDSGEALDLISGTNITLTESDGDVTIAAARRPVTAGGNTLANGETLAFTAGSNITITESGGAVTIASVNDTNTFRPVTAGGNTLTSAETLAFTAGTNVTITENAGAVTINSSRATRATLNIDTDDDVVFKSLELTGHSNATTLKAPATFTIDPATHGNATGTVVIDGNLTVKGSTTTINSTTVQIDDLVIELANNADSLAEINGAGIRIGDDTTSSAELGLVEFLYSQPNGRMELSSKMKVTGGLEATTLLSCTIDGGTF